MERAIFYLRISLGAVFLWFGILKVFNYNPVFEIVYASFPFLSYGVGNFLLGLFETIIGLGLLINFFSLLTHVALVAHLLGTMAAVVLAPEIMFYPYFPILTLAGEFVIKNLVLLFAGLAVLAHGRSRTK